MSEIKKYSNQKTLTFHKIDADMDIHVMNVFFIKEYQTREIKITEKISKIQIFEQRADLI